MVSLRPRILSGAASVALIAGFMLTAPSAAIAAGGGSLTCHGGPIPSGTYSSLVVAGSCLVVEGSVTVTGNLTVAPGGVLLQAFGGSNLVVGRNLIIGKNGAAAIGCEPEAFPCLDDPDASSGGTTAATFYIHGNLTANSALAVLAHNGTVGRNVAQSGGGGGVNCDSQDALMGSPAYATYEDVKIGGNANITGFRSCWLGLFRDEVGGNVNFHNNVVADPDGNEVATNDIGGNLNCSANSPAPQVGDSFGDPNMVGGKATGQCRGLTG
jgi:hypothetical protein